MPPRSVAQRKADALDKLEHDDDLWLATASASGVPHLVPLSFVWDGVLIVAATESGSITARNVGAFGRARVALGPTRDVVVVDVRVDTVTAADVDRAAAQRLADRLGWDPRSYDEPWVYLLMRPTRVLVWREADELDDRVVMRGGEWLV